MLALLLACTGDPTLGDSAPPPGMSVASVTVSPPVATVHSSSTGGESVTFSAVATFADGSVSAVTDAEWEVSNSSAGSVTQDGAFVARAGSGGVTWVTARFGGQEGTATVTVIYQETVNEAGVDVTLFDAPETVTSGLWTYPANGVNFPRNTPSITFQWADVGHAAARLRFTSAITDLTVYTTGTSWTATEDLWESIAATNAGGTVQVELALAVGGTVQKEKPITLNVNRMDGQGTVYYWSTSASGIRRIPYGGEAEDYLTASQTGRCVGCHSVGVDRLAFTYDGGDGSLGLKELSTTTDILAPDLGNYGNFHAFSPDGRYLVSAFHGVLTLRDAVTGAYLGEVATGGYASMPSWSPDGDQLAFAWYAEGGYDFYFGDGKIVVMDHLGDGVFGPATVLYDPPDPYNAYYPAFSPDSEWIAFNVSTGDSYDDSDAMMYVIHRDGGTPIELTQANLTSGITNSWPKWGPLPDDDILWLAFSSKRTYGNLASGYPQLWVTAFDPAKAAAGEDPSWPAFWLPGQDVSQSNHIPYWTR